MIRNFARAALILLAILLVMADAQNRDEKIAAREAAAMAEAAL